MWAALTALALAVIGGLAVELIVLASRALYYLQPLLIPVAVAAIFAYLLDPVVERITRFGITRTKAVLYVFAIVFLPLVAIITWVTPQIYHQSIDLGEKFPGLIDNARTHLLEAAQKYQAKYAENAYVQQMIQEAIAWTQLQLPTLPGKVWNFITGSIEGFLGVFGFLIGMMVVPIYLFFFLRDAATISRRWSDYLPLRSSDFKDEVVACLTEINRYLIAFFRGQILVTMIDGTLIGLALLFMGLNFALLIGLLVMVLQLIPYVGILLCWVPAVLIAIAQFGDWQHPLIVTAIFIFMVQLDGWFIAPRIVGEAVGLHPMTIIVSVIGWSLLIGGLLGALLAVPLTATLKVLLKRYVWERSLVRRKITLPVNAGGSVLVEIPE
ncbi:MAG: hypothetical protein QOD99_592 [Chthoniobacter sp.]|nr:hypothetical protein [Chthoniobacter sp.]